MNEQPTAPVVPTSAPVPSPVLDNAPGAGPDLTDNVLPFHPPSRFAGKVESTPVAPAVPATPAAPTADASPIAPKVGRNAVRAQILGDAAASVPGDDALAVETAPPAPPEGTATAATTTTEAQATTEAPKTDTPPEGLPDPVGPLKLQFRAKDGTYADHAPLADTTITFEVGGKKYEKDVQGLARMAADGISLRGAAERVQYWEGELFPKVEQAFDEVSAELEAQKALNRELLSSEETYYKRREEYATLTSPEARAERAERALADREQQDATAKRQGEIASHYQQAVAPHLTSILAECPLLSNEEVLGRITLDTGPLAVNGVIPPERHPEFARYLAGPFAQWARSRQAEKHEATAARETLARETERKRQAEAEAQAAAERTKAQLQARDVGRSLTPTGATPTGTGTSPDRPPRSRAEARAQILAGLSSGG